MWIRNWRYFSGLVLIIVIIVFGCSCSNKTKKLIPSKSSEKLFYLTKADKSQLFARQESGIKPSNDKSLPSIVVEPEKSFQTMDGFGFTLTGGSALHIHNMSEGKRQKLLEELFDTKENNIGISYLRISLGASDLDDSVFSYNDIPAGETDMDLEHFSIHPDRQHLIPVLQEILKINPGLKIMASPWSPPVWMKTNLSSIGGSLKKECYTVYANYFVKYVHEMQKEGIPIDAITVQNEPLHPGNNPSLFMLAEDQAVFVKNFLGPAFEKADIKTKIIIYDHNADRIDYPISILNDPDAKKYIDGSAFHLYGGAIESLSQVHHAHPDKNLYFTEQWIGSPGDFANDFKWHMDNLIIGASGNWCKTVLEWNLAADAQQKPHTSGGCDRCLGALTIVGDSVIRNPAYYIIAHASKFVRPGSKRIESNVALDLPNVAFKTPGDQIVVIVLNNSETEIIFNLNIDNQLHTSLLESGSAGTYVF